MRRRIFFSEVLVCLLIALLFVVSSGVGEATSPSLPLLAGAPTSTPQKNPPKATPSPSGKQTPAIQPPPVSTKPQDPRSVSSPASDPWIQIMSEGFEFCVMPCPGWTVVDRSNDGYDRKWGDSNWFAHQGSWAVWPAAHGNDSIYPPTEYPNNMDTRMIYGPFDLSNAQYGYTRFWLWRDMEQDFDWIALEASHTGNDNDFQEIARWTGSSGGYWEQKEAWLDNYVGDNSVWLSWRFYGDYSVTAQGPWVDDIELWKYVPTYVTAKGTFSYYDRDGTTLKPARFMTAYLYDSNPGGVDELLATTATNASGYFQFPPIMNWEANGSNRDLYVVWETAYNDPSNSYVNPTRRVTDFGNNAYRYYSFVCTDCPDGIADFSSYLPTNFPNLEASWFFQDLRRGWEFVRNNTSPQSDPGSATAKWQDGQNALFPCDSSCFYAGGSTPYIFIANSDRISADTVVHELGHHYMYNANGWWWWSPTCFGHQMFLAKETKCGWSEGWADFFPIVVNQTLPNNANDTCYDFDIGPCTGAPDQLYFNIETHSRNDNLQQFPWGESVEGRNAGALYDLYDYANDGYDQIGFGFVPIWNIVKTQPWTIFDFWSSWKATGYEKHFAVQSIYQNTIDYDTAPAFSNLPSSTFLQGITYNNAVDLWLYSSDPESANSQLRYFFVSSTDWRCGASVYDHYVNFAIQPGWVGSCNVTVRVNDGIKNTDGTFIVNVVPIRSRNYLPIIMR